MFLKYLKNTLLENCYTTAVWCSFPCLFFSRKSLASCLLPQCPCHLILVSHSMVCLASNASFFTIALCYVFKVFHYKICESILTCNLLSHRGIPNYEFRMGRITFIRNSRPQPKKIVDDVRNAN